ncbi:MAG: GlsB/YeaQ/YmgE family stress response membrane protein [Solirubrobacteraceae bacterium]
MGLLLYLIILFVIGLFVGALARLLIPGPDPMGILATAAVGLAGTFTAGLFSWYVLHRHGGGLLLSVLFSMLVVWLVRRSRTGAPARRGPRRW